MKTIAQQCLEAEDPYLESSARQAYKGQPSAFVKVFHFHDGSYLPFKVTYTPADAGRSLPCPPQNGI